MKNLIFIIIILVISCSKKNQSLEHLIKESITTNNWKSFYDFTNEKVKCDICLDKEVHTKLMNFKNYTDTINNFIYFDKNTLLEEKLPNIFKNSNSFKIEDISNSEKNSDNKNEFEIHIPMKNQTSIDFHFKAINGENKLIAIYQTP